MAVYTININERTQLGKALLEYLKNLGVIVSALSLKKEKYDPEFVKKIKSQEDLPSVRIKTEDLWK